MLGGGLRGLGEGFGVEELRGLSILDVRFLVPLRWAVYIDSSMIFVYQDLNHGRLYILQSLKAKESTPWCRHAHLPITNQHFHKPLSRHLRSSTQSFPAFSMETLAAV